MRTVEDIVEGEVKKQEKVVTSFVDDLGMTPFTSQRVVVKIFRFFQCNGLFSLMYSV